jgi:glycosyltransferase involved in cell wall biosynthesis
MAARPVPPAAGATNGGRRLAVLAVGEEATASTRFRVLAHLPALAEAGYETSLRLQRPLPGARAVRLPLRLVRELVDLRHAADADLLMIQRRCYPPWFAPRLVSRNRPMVFDVDDAVDLPPPGAPQSDAGRRRYRRNFEATVERADLVLCGNRELAARVPHGRTLILPTAVDCDRFHPDIVEPVDPGAAGWVGHSSNLGFLEAIAEPLREIARRHPGFRLVVVCDRPPRLDGVPVEFRSWSLDGELDDLRGLAIGLMPLEDTPWTRSKCAFKLLQYMALGLPAVASPVGANRDVVQDGTNGLLARTDDEWVEALDALLRQPELRHRLGRAGRQAARDRYDLPVVSGRLIEALDGLALGTRSGP